MFAAELLKRMDTHVRAKFSGICPKLLLLNGKLAKKALFDIFTQFDNVFSFVICFFVFFYNLSAKKNQ